MVTTHANLFALPIARKVKDIPGKVDKALGQANVAHLCVYGDGLARNITEQLLMLGLICWAKVWVVDAKVAEGSRGDGWT